MDKAPKLHVFRFHKNYDNEEMEQEFYNFFSKYGLSRLFVNEDKLTQIYVSDSDVRSVVNTSGTYHKSLVDMGELLLMSDDNKMYEEAVTRVIYNAGSFTALMKKIRQITEYFIAGVIKEHEFNFWNIVWYNKDLQYKQGNM